MSGYADTKKLIEDTLVGRPAGTMIYPEGHQAIDMSLLDYIHSVELLGASGLQGIATTSTVPVQPDNAKVSYIAMVPAGETYVFTNFHDQNGDSISITTGANTVSLLIFLWNGEYWQVQNNQVQLMLNITAGHLYAGVAVPTTDPGSPDEPVFYIAAEAGTYENFGNIILNDNEVAVLKYDNTLWTKELILDYAPVDSLDSDSTTRALSAHQGKVLAGDIEDKMIKSQSWTISGNVTYNDMEIPQSYDIMWSDGVAGSVTLSNFDENVLEYCTMVVTRGTKIITYTTVYDENGYIIEQSINIQ